VLAMDVGIRGRLWHRSSLLLLFAEEFTFLSEISPLWHQDCVCSDLSKTRVGLPTSQRFHLIALPAAEE